MQQISTRWLLRMLASSRLLAVSVPTLSVASRTGNRECCCLCWRTNVFGRLRLLAGSPRILSALLGRGSVRRFRETP
ncbi:hypothetical protein Y032_0005g2340 [Ancylostoma ceylanicum]|uniref:Secreted protein n=1 Tax=Ancylostoma ceylanicum TaxID=53326 RepID=A0A016VQT1_9BILA|nr:hypothetical protein Y032_0005g2340 [Ancylostoma ceylanicum]